MWHHHSILWGYFGEMLEWKVIIEDLWILTWVLRQLFVLRKKINSTYIDK